MGSATSMPKNNASKSTKSGKTVHKNLHKSQVEVVKLMMPVYYTLDPLTPQDRNLANTSWEMIVNDTAPEFIAGKKDPDFPYQSCVTFFYDKFYSRLFDVHPWCRQLFVNGMRSQGKFLVKMISLALSEIQDPSKFDKTLIQLAEVHYERGVKAVEYGIVGEVLLWVLRSILGTTVYNAAVHQAWIKIYCRMIRTIIPVAVSLELHQGQAEKHKERNSSFHEERSISVGYTETAENRHKKAEDALLAKLEDESQKLHSEKIREAESTKSHHSHFTRSSFA